MVTKVREPQRRLILKHKRAKQLRANTTEAERKLWRLLRNKQFAGLRFRRQQPIGPYVADFYCSAAKLIIELDGEHHAEADAPRHDQVRTEWLRTRVTVCSVCGMQTCSAIQSLPRLLLVR